MSSLRDSNSVRDGHQLRALLAHGQRLFLDHTHAAGVVLPLELVVDRAVFAGDERLPEGTVGNLQRAAAPEHARLVERVARCVLLPVGLSRLGLGEHDDARLAVAYTGFPGAVIPDPATVFVVA